MKIVSGYHSQIDQNRLMVALLPEDREHLQAQMQMVHLTYRQLVQLSGERVSVVYFPITAVLSLISIMSDGSSMELGMVGSEGMAGLPALLGAGAQPFEMVVVIPGTAYRMPAKALSDVAHGSASLEDLLLQYTQVFLDQIAQGAACSSQHSVKQRLARLLMTLHDNIQTDRLRVTQEFLGQMLGVTRPRVSLAAASFQQEGLIRSSRGIITIIDRPGLAAAACECYQIIREEYDHLYA